MSSLSEDLIRGLKIGIFGAILIAVWWGLFYLLRLFLGNSADNGLTEQILNYVWAMGCGAVFGLAFWQFRKTASKHESDDPG